MRTLTVLLAVGWRFRVCQEYRYRLCGKIPPCPVDGLTSTRQGLYRVDKVKFVWKLFHGCPSSGESAINGHV